MIVFYVTPRTFDRKVNKIKSLAKKKYYLQKTLKKIDKEIAFDLSLLNIRKDRYREKRHASDLELINFMIKDALPEERRFRTYVLNLLIKFGGR